MIGSNLVFHLVNLTRSYSTSKTKASPLMQFFENGIALPPWDREKKPIYGRAWRATELRLKSFEDLHALWFVLLKERNVLATQEAEAKRQVVPFMGDHRVEKCCLSMARIKQVLTERQLRYKEAVQQWKTQQKELMHKTTETTESSKELLKESSSVTPAHQKTLHRRANLQEKLDLIERMNTRMGLANVEWARKFMKDRLSSQRSYRKWRRAIVGKHPRF